MGSQRVSAMTCPVCLIGQLSHSKSAAARNDFAASNGRRGDEQFIADTLLIVTVRKQKTAFLFFENRHVRN